MYCLRLGLLCLLVVAPVWAQQPSASQQNQQTTASTAPFKDAQATAVLQQALTVAGGTETIRAILDFTATGSISDLSGGSAEQGTVTIKGRGLGQLRIDATFSSGTRSEAVDGVTTIRQGDGITQEIRTQSPLYPVRMILPFLHLAPVATSTAFNVVSKGKVSVGGIPAYDIQVQRAISQANDSDSLLSKFLTMDYIVDAATYRIVMMEDVVQKGLPREVVYGDFRSLSGLLVPFSITEVILGHTIRQIQFDKIVFNSGLQDSDFQL